MKFFRKKKSEQPPGYGELISCSEISLEDRKESEKEPADDDSTSSNSFGEETHSEFLCETERCLQAVKKNHKEKIQDESERGANPDSLRQLLNRPCSTPLSRQKLDETSCRPKSNTSKLSGHLERSESGLRLEEAAANAVSVCSSRASLRKQSSQRSLQKQNSIRSLRGSTTKDRACRIRRSSIGPGCNTPSSSGDRLMLSASLQESASSNYGIPSDGTFPTDETTGGYGYEYERQEPTDYYGYDPQEFEDYGYEPQCTEQETPQILPEVKMQSSPEELCARATRRVQRRRSLGQPISTPTSQDKQRLRRRKSIGTPNAVTKGGDIPSRRTTKIPRRKSVGAMESSISMTTEVKSESHQKGESPVSQTKHEELTEEAARRRKSTKNRNSKTKSQKVAKDTGNLHSDEDEETQLIQHVGHNSQNKSFVQIEFF